MSKGISTYLFLFFISLSVFGQRDTLRLSLVLIDKETNSPIESAFFSIKSSSHSGMIKQKLVNGDTLSFACSLTETWKVTAKTSGYKTLDTIIDSKLYERDIRRKKVVAIQLEFTFDGQYSDQVEINATYKPFIKFQSEKLSVSDFEIVDDHRLLLLTYPNRLEKGSELILYENDQVKNSRIVEFSARQLIHDYRRKIYLRCENKMFRITPQGEIVMEEVDARQLENYRLPILDSLEEDRLYFSNYVSHYPAYDYYMVTRNDTTYTKIKHLEDEVMLEQYRAEYKWADVRTKLWAWDMEVETGIDREVWVGANVFTNSIYYDPPIGDFFRVDDLLYVFDYYDDQLITYDGFSGSKLDSVTISFHERSRKTGWEEHIVQDPISKKLYTFFDEAGYMQGFEVDLESGRLKDPFKLFYRYVENIQVYDGQVYYIYRPFESPQKKYLYYELIDRMRLK